MTEARNRAAGSVLVRFRSWWPAWATDVVVVLVVMWAVVLSEVKNPASPGLPAPWDVVLAVLASLVLLARRRYPVAVLAVSLAATFAHVASFGVIAAFYALGAYCRDRRLMWICAVLGLVAALPWATLVDEDLGTLADFLVVQVFMWLLPFVLGLYAHTRRDYLAGLVDRAEHAEREQALIAERARGEERTRIAREMHDVVANQVSLVVMHAGALRMVVHKDPDQATHAAEVIENVGQQALRELRQMLGVLRSGDSDPPSSGSSTPRVREIPTLVESSREAGLHVNLRIEGDPGELPEQVERAAYRVVQEALTNVHKHAGGSRAEVLVEHETQHLRVRVDNTPPADGFERSLPSGGHGLDGLRERVELVGGDIEAGPRREGGYRVRATLPTEAPN